MTVTYIFKSLLYLKTRLLQKSFEQFAIRVFLEEKSTFKKKAKSKILQLRNLNYILFTKPFPNSTNRVFSIL